MRISTPSTARSPRHIPEHAMLRVHGRFLSRLLRAYYLAPNHPMKLRLWTILRRWLGRARLKMPYAGRGWITVHEADYIDREILLTGGYETEVWEAIADFAR